MINHSSQSGFALILSLIVSSVALAIGLSLLDITIKQLTLSSTTRESEIAFQTAAAGMNCLQYARNQQPTVSQANNSTFQIDCLGKTITFTDSAPGNTVQQQYSGQVDWTVDPTAGKNVCIEYDMIVVDATGGQQTYTLSSTGQTKTCQSGDICTYALSRGHNLDCATVSGASVFAVQRELTAEF
jgi:Tfp pilus assembly protein PilX